MKEKTTQSRSEVLYLMVQARVEAEHVMVLAREEAQRIIDQALSMMDKAIDADKVQDTYEALSEMRRLITKARAARKD